MTGEEAAALASVQYVDKQRGIAVVLEGEGGDLKGKHIYVKFNHQGGRWLLIFTGTQSFKTILSYSLTLGTFTKF